MPVSIVIASFGVDCGTWRILFMMFMIVCIFWVSLCVVVLLSASYVNIGMMHVSTSFHIIAILVNSSHIAKSLYALLHSGSSPMRIFQPLCPMFRV